MNVPGSTTTRAAPSLFTMTGERFTTARCMACSRRPMARAKRDWRGPAVTSTNSDKERGFPGGDKTDSMVDDNRS